MILEEKRTDLAHDLILPTLLFAALGGMTWAVRGCSGFGAVAGCVFAGVTWGAAWWFIALDPKGERTRRYQSGWIIMALTVGIGLAGARGWMQWPHFFDGKMLTKGQNESVPIPRIYGFLWLFLAGVPWAGLGACLLAWCGPRRDVRGCQWALRIGCGIGCGILARWTYDAFPQWFLPMYDTYHARYNDFAANPNLRRLRNDCGFAVVHLGYYFGFLLFEVIRKEWKNATLILTVGLINGVGWATLSMLEVGTRRVSGEYVQLLAMLGVVGGHQYWNRAWGWHISSSIGSCRSKNWRRSKCGGSGRSGRNCWSFSGRRPSCTGSSGTNSVAGDDCISAWSRRLEWSNLSSSGRRETSSAGACTSGC